MWSCAIAHAAHRRFGCDRRSRSPSASSGRQSNKEIGAQLYIAEGTVKTHVKTLFEKLNVVGRTGAIREAVHRGLIRLN